MINLINAIGTVTCTDSSKAKIDAARSAYNALSSSQKELVANYATLTAAESRYAVLKTSEESDAAQEAARQAASQAADSQTASTAQEVITISKTPKSVKAKAKKNKVTVSWKKITKTKKTKALLKQVRYIEYLPGAFS